MPRHANRLLLYQKNLPNVAFSFDLHAISYIINSVWKFDLFEGVQNDRITGSENGKAKERVC